MRIQSIIFAALLFLLNGHAYENEFNLGVATGQCRDGQSIDTGIQSYRPFMTVFIYSQKNSTSFVTNCLRYLYHGCLLRTHIDQGFSNPNSFNRGLSYAQEHKDVFGPKYFPSEPSPFSQYSHPLIEVVNIATKEALSPTIKDVMCYPGPPEENIKHNYDNLQHPNFYREITLDDAHRLNPEVEEPKFTTPNVKPHLIFIPGLGVGFNVTPGTKTGDFFIEVERITKHANPIAIAAIIFTLILFGVVASFGAVSGVETFGLGFIVSVSALKAAGASIIAICLAWNISVNKKALTFSSKSMASIESKRKVPQSIKIHESAFNIKNMSDHGFVIEGQESNAKICTKVDFDISEDDSDQRVSADRSCD